MVIYHSDINSKFNFEAHNLCSPIIEAKRSKTTINKLTQKNKKEKEKRNPRSSAITNKGDWNENNQRATKFLLSQLEKEQRVR